MRSIGVREFRDQATSILAGDETIVIERHGRPIGFFVPIGASDRKRGRASLGRLEATVERILDETGVDETVLARELAPKRRTRR
jgi:antitoxin (DNA-binding transcriptional repressor) of toxin-antitoxin stability system